MNCKKLLALLLTLVMLVTVLPIGALTVSAENTTEFLGGDGTEENPYLISNKTHLNNVRNHLDAHFKMVADIEFTEADFAKGGEFYNDGQGWKPIGGAGEPSFFTGSFHGNSHTIAGLISHRSSVAGLFGHNNGTIQNLGMINGEMSASSVGGIAETNYHGTISQCYNTSNVTATSMSSDAYAGGIAGKNYGSINNCYNTGSVSGVSSAMSLGTYAGGIAGKNCGTLSECYNQGIINSTAIFDAIYGTSSYVYTKIYSYSGGVVGYDQGTVTSCYNTNNISSTAEVKSSNHSTVTGFDAKVYSYAGGIIGYGKNAIADSYNLGEISSTIVQSLLYKNTEATAYSSGIIGYCENGLIRNCYNVGNVLITSNTSYASQLLSSYTYAGGIVGYHGSGTLNNCHNTGNISIVAIPNSQGPFDEIRAYAGGVLGAGVKVVNCYNTGSVEVNIKISENSSRACAYAGGISGRGGNPQICYNTGNIKSSTTSAWSRSYAGGIIGEANGRFISDCYNTASVSSSNCAGGIVGTAGNDSISNCYNTGLITAPKNAGIVCLHYGSVLNNCYYLDNMNIGVGNREDTAICCTTEEMKRQSTFIGFDFSYIWKFGVSAGYPYPQLRKPIKNIELLSYPNTIQVVEGLQPDLTGVTVRVTNDDDEKIVIEATTQMLSELNVRQIGIQTIHLTYIGQTTAETIDIEVIPKSIVSVSVTTPPTKTTYVQGQPLNPSGGTLTVYYNNNTSEEVDLSEAELSYAVDQTGEITVTAEYQGFEASFAITITERVIKSIGLIEPEKLSYVEGQDLDLTGGKLQIIYVSEDNYTEHIPLELDMISGYVPDQLGIQTLTVTYGGKTANFVINVKAKTVTRIEVTTLPNNLKYLESKDDLDVSGGKITIYYDNDFSEIVDLTADMVSGFDNTKVRKQTLTVTYGDQTTTFEVEIIAKSLDSIKVTTLPSKRNYLEGKDKLDVSGGKLTLTYNNGTSEEIDLTADMVSGFDNTKVGKQTLTIAYGGKVATFEISVIPAAPPAPTLSSRTDTTVTLKSIAGYEYRMDNGAWQMSNVFTGLAPNSTHQFYQRVAETDTSYASDSSPSLSVTTSKSQTTAPSAPTLSGKTDTTVTLKSIAGYEYRMDNGAWQASNVFTGLTPNSTHNFYQRVAETGTSYASDSSPSLSITTDKSQTTAPNTPTMHDKTTTTVTLTATEGYEYSKDGVNWQSSPTFTGLKPNTEYRFYQRVKETSTHHASPSSAAFVVKTNPEYVIGDLIGDKKVTDADAIYLLYYTLLPDLYPINQSADYNGDGKVTDADAIYLLYYTLLPDLYPLH